MFLMLFARTKMLDKLDNVDFFKLVATNNFLSEYISAPKSICAVYQGSIMP